MKNSDVPKKINLPDKVKKIKCGSTHSGCITSNNKIYIWGNGMYGQIGNGKKENSLIPTLVTTENNGEATDLALGSNHCVALIQEKTKPTPYAYAWGSGTYGRLGLNSEKDTQIPTKIPMLNNKTIREVYAGGSVTCCVAGNF
jgi:alpha-tubulin suppressor-like RCC1 family protein